MGIGNMVNTVKEIHPVDVLLVRVGAFYISYEKDAYIMNYIFNYKLTKTQEMYTTGFPLASLSRVMATLEKNKINYIVLDRRNNYDVEEQKNFDNLNNYDKYLEKVKQKVNIARRIENIVETLQTNNKLILEVEKVIYEGRKI